MKRSLKKSSVLGGGYRRICCDVCLSSVGETRSRKVSHSASSINVNPRATGLVRELVGCWALLANQTRPGIAMQ